MIKKISIKVQSILVMLIFATFMLIMLSIVFISVVSRDFKNIEITQANRNISRVKEIYELILDSYTKKIVDWGNWDDTYKFVKDLNKNYISSNLGVSSLESLEVDVISYYDTKLDFIYGVSVKEDELPYDIKNLLKGNNVILNELNLKNESSGLVKLQSGLALYSAHTILKSDRSGPSNGYIFFVRHIGDWFTDSMTQTLKTPIKFTADTKHDGIINFGEKSLISYFKLPIKNSNQFLNLSIEMSREIWVQVIETTRLLVLMVGSAILVAIVINYLFFNATVVKDLKSLQDEVRQITEKQGKEIIKSKGSSLETNKLREDINVLINLIYKSKIEAEDKAHDLDRINSLMTDREIRMTELKNVINDLKKKII